MQESMEESGQLTLAFTVMLACAVLRRQQTCGDQKQTASQLDGTC